MTMEASRDVASLVETHRTAIDAIRKIVMVDGATEGENGMDQGLMRLDDLVLLRYVLSCKGDIDQAIASVRQGVEYRRTHRSWIEAARDPAGVAPHSELLQRHLVGAVHKSCSDETPVYIVRSGHTSAGELWSSGASVEQVMEWATFRKESLYWTCDAITRRTGRLTKAIYVIDMNHSNIVQDLRGARAFGSSTRLSDFLHPQLIERTVVLHPPATFRILFAFAKRFVSAKSIEKICVCRCTRNRGVDISSCPFVSARMSPDDVPTFLGGSCRCVDDRGRCIAGIANDSKNRADRS
mmetsp:Transcript_18360/g.38357  ORF Transcript_18360/g.38357 Transcript_18360/m.38357 type:complete len:296 (-) Transcript_18360:3320-4207(-)